MNAIETHVSGNDGTIQVSITDDGHTYTIVADQFGGLIGSAPANIPQAIKLALKKAVQSKARSKN